MSTPIINSDSRLPKASGMYMHCGKCMREKPPSRSPEEYARLAVSRTPHGIQVWCNRHNVNVAYVSFDWGDASAPQCGGCAVCESAP